MGTVYFTKKLRKTRICALYREFFFIFRIFPCYPSFSANSMKWRFCRKNILSFIDAYEATDRVRALNFNKKLCDFFLKYQKIGFSFE